MRVIGVVWNLCLVAAFAYLASFILPKTLDAFQGPFFFDGAPMSFTVHVLFVPLEGIGLLAAIVLFLFSLSTVFWKAVHRRWRWFYGLSAIVILLGVVTGAVIAWWDIGFFMYDLPFIALVIVTALPVVLFGTGYVGLMKRGWLAVTKK